MQNTREESRSLYLRWRPTRFQEVVGQEGTVRILQNSVKRGKTSHAYLFAGPRGTGKTSVARVLAKSLNCENSQDGEPCNSCSSCRKIDQGTALDIVEIDGASNRRIGRIRELREEVNFTPAELQNKVYIIDEVHMLTNEAFNALLKTIEEPPDKVTFIFATTEPEKVPATIVSRCQVFEFTEIAKGAIEKRLREVASSEGVDITDEALGLISSRARGSMRDGLVLLEQIVSYDSSGKVEKEDLFELLGLSREEVTKKYSSALLAGQPREALEVLDDLESRGKDPELFLDQVLKTLRGRIKETTEPGALEKLVRLSRGLLNVSDDLKQSSHKRVALEIGTLELVGKGSEGGREATGKTGGSSKEEYEGEGEGTGAPEAPPAGEEEDAKVPPEGDSSEEENGGLRESKEWQEMIERIEEEKISIAAFLEEANPVLRNRDLYLEFGKEFSFHKESLEKDQNFSYLREIVKSSFDEIDQLRITYREREGQDKVKASLLDEKTELFQEEFGGNVVEEGRL